MQHVDKAFVQSVIGTKYKLALGSEKPRDQADNTTVPTTSCGIAWHRPPMRWSADLVVMHLLTVIDVLSKYAWCMPLKSETGQAIVNAFDDMLK